jgi:hypothetical protein
LPLWRKRVECLDQLRPRHPVIVRLNQSSGSRFVRSGFRDDFQALLADGGVFPRQHGDEMRRFLPHHLLKLVAALFSNGSQCLRIELPSL